MADTKADVPLRVALTLEFVARYGMAGLNLGGLSNAQWVALRFFQGFNRFSRTLTGFSAFHSTTRASASQTISSLVSKGYLVRIPDERDGRRVQFDLTEKAKELCSQQPHSKLVQAIAGLPEAQRTSLESALQAVLAQMADSFQEPVPGGCTECRYFKDRFDPMEKAVLRFCSRVRSDLEDEDVAHECIYHVAKA